MFVDEKSVPIQESTHLESIAHKALKNKILLYYSSTIYCFL